MEPIRLPRAYTIIVDRIRNLIVSGELGPGDKLPTERELAEKLGVSRSSMREALTALEVMGIIETRAGLGNYVAHDLPAGHTEYDLAALIADGGTLEILEARRMLEPHVAEVSAGRRTDEDLHAMWLCIEEMERTTATGDDAWGPDWGFHTALANACQNPVIEAIVGLLAQRMTSRLWHAMRGQNFATDFSRAQSYLKDHKVIYGAVRDQDSCGAARLMIDHLDRIISDLGESPEQSGASAGGSGK